MPEGTISGDCRDIRFYW